MPAWSGIEILTGIIFRRINMPSKKGIVVVIDTNSFRKLFTSKGFWIFTLILVSGGMALFAISISLTNISPGDPVSATPIMANFNTLKTAIEQSQVPVGTICAWHKSLTGTPSIAYGWVECNGQTLSDADSPYNGQVIPNLNGDGRFLRGSSTSGTLQSDDVTAHSHGAGTLSGASDAASNHSHSFSWSGNSASAGSHNHAMYFGAAAAGTAPTGNASTTPNSVASSSGGDHAHSITVSGTSGTDGAHSHTVTVSGASGSTGGTETRPDNMSVVWIIKIK
jgi:hypothetical protein